MIIPPVSAVTAAPQKKNHEEPGSNKIDNDSNEEKSVTKTTQPSTTETDSVDNKIVQELVARDREVRTHEQAHLSAAGAHATSGASFTYERGPNGVLYATGGEVSIDSSPVPNDPQATIAKAEVIQRAALAPANPSAQDRSVAAQASQMETQARTELLSKSGNNENDDKTETRNQRPEISAYEEIETYNEDLPREILLGLA